MPDFCCWEQEEICSAEDLKKRNKNIQIGKIRGVALIKKVYGRKKNCEGEMRKSLLF